MSKAEILAALPALAPSERQEIIEQLWDLEEIALLRGAEPAPEVKAVLNQALQAYRAGCGFTPTVAQWRR